MFALRSQCWNWQCKTMRLSSVFQRSRGSRVCIEAPSTNLQAPEKLQTSNSNQRWHRPGYQCETALRRVPAGSLKSGLMIGAWMFSGAWCLEVGAFVSQGSIGNSKNISLSQRAICVVRRLLPASVFARTPAHEKFNSPAAARSRGAGVRRYNFSSGPNPGAARDRAPAARRSGQAAGSSA